MDKPTPLKAAVLGHPIAHSLSPQLHGFWLAEHGIHGSYEAMDTPPEQLAATLQQLAAQGYRGVNLTVPLKEAVLPLLDEIDEAAQAIGAVNTVTFQQGKMQGYNTDAFGFVENLRQSLKAQSKPLQDYLGYPVVLGAGGAARAVVAGLLQAGEKHITLTNRSHEKAEKLAEDFRASYGNDEITLEIATWENRHNTLAQASLLVNSTSLGMQGKPPLEIDLALLPQDALVTDIVYKPLQTALLQQAAARGNITVDGLGMLLYQAQPAFEKFFGVKPRVTQPLRDIVLG